MNYYNEWDKGAAAWLRELIKAGHLPQGYVDERSITEVTPGDLEGFTQCHFFAGIGGWPLALHMAGVRSDQRLWTGSPPCQPFSVAGKQLGQLDERHLAPAFMRLVAQCRPPVLFGEQVAAAIGKYWLDDLFAELEKQDYACGAAVLPACSVGAPHKRDRLFFGAQLLEHASGFRRQQGRIGDNGRNDRLQSAAAGEGGGVAQPMRAKRDGEWLHGLGESDQAQGSGSAAESAGCGDTVKLGDTNNTRPQIGRGEPGEQPVSQRREDAQRPGGLPGLSGELADSDCERREGQRLQHVKRSADIEAGRSGEDNTTDPNHSFWSDADWLGCRDGKFRPVESGTFPLANGVPARVGRLRGYGNAIVPQVAAEFIKAFEGAIDDAGN